MEASVRIAAQSATADAQQATLAVQTAILQATFDAETTNASLVSPSATETVTPSESINDTLPPIATDPQSLSVGSNQGEQFAAALEEAFARVPGILSVETISVLPATNSPINVYAEMRVQSGYRSTDTADALLQLTYQTLVTASVEFSVILDDGTLPEEYLWSNATDTWQVTPLTATTTFQAQPLGDCPSLSLTCNQFLSCEEAVACLQAGNHRLDPDGDGLPCEQTLCSELPAQSSPTAFPMSTPQLQPSDVMCPSLSATCSQLTCAQAYACLQAGNSDLDRNNDGVPCESVCGG